MPQMVKTTLLLPEDLLQMAKIAAVQQKTTVSAMVRDTLDRHLSGAVTTPSRKDPMKSLGTFSIGIKKVYNKRSDLYEDHLRRKMGY